MAQPSFDSILNAVMQAESGGRRYDSRGNLLTSDKGAKGEMQVLDTTKFSPGFGVEPAKANTPDERARVGRDYLRAMLDRYGDIDKALAAYNWGPGNTDKWIARGADPAKLPAETQGYISKIKSSLTGAPRTTAQASATPEAAPAAAPARGAPAAAPVRVSEARPADLGPSYQAALALSFLSDEDEKESGRREYDERQPSAASQWLARETRKVTPESLAMPFRSPFAEPEPVKAADGGFIAVGYEDGGEVEAVASKSTEPPSRPEPFRVPPGQMEARLREFNRLDPATQSLIARDDPRVQFALTPAPASVSAPYTLSTMPGARALYDQTLAGTTTGGYVHPALRMQDRSSLKQIPTQDVVFLRPGRDQAQELQSRAHEAEHLLAKRGLGDATAINDKFDELMKDSKARRAFVEKAVSVQPYLEKTYGTKSTYFMPEMLAFQDKRGRGANLLYEQFAELAAIEQATGKDLTKDPELRKTIFKDKKVREVYNALTGLRQTRLDARDLSPYTPIPEKSDGMMEFIRSKLGFKEGGEAKSEDAPSPEELERASKAAFGIAPSSGKGRKQSRVSEALQSGEAQLAAAKGLTMLPQNVVGAPVDIATLVARPFGYNVEKPVMGSEYLKEKTRAAGLAFQEPQDPTLRAFFQAGDISSNLINPAGATRTAVRGVEKTGQAAKELAEFATRPVERDPFLSGPMGAQRGAVRMPGTPDPTLAYLAGVPSAEKPFVGRLDQHVAGLSGTMQKEQFLNSLKGKFRDYDLARASEALADLGPTDKIKPVQILERLKTTYSPQSFRTIIHEPELGMFHQGTDNVYYDTSTVNNPPLGVAVLSLDLGPQVAKKQEGSARASDLLEKLFRYPNQSVSADDIKFFDDYLKTSLNTDPKDVDQLMPLLKEAYRVGENYRAAKSARDDLVYPSHATDFLPRVDKYYAELVQQGAPDPGEASMRMARESVQKDAFRALESFMPKERVAAIEKAFFSGDAEAKATAIDNLELATKAMSSYLKGTGADFANSLPGKQALYDIQAAAAYKGQHTELKAGNNPIGFSRFSEHTTQVPGVGEVSLMHFHELQSDLLQDVRMYGPAKGSREKDKKQLADLEPRITEAAQKLKQAHKDAVSAHGRRNLEGEKYAPLAETSDKKYKVAQNEYDSLANKKSILESRIGSGRATYELPEAFAGMELSPQVMQQLLVKNAVNAAIQRGKSGATFPGKESEKPHLYENLLNNLRQVAKDLGPGFEVRPVTLEGPNYTEFSHYGIFWGPEAAARIQKKGVPFKDGGMVERADDTRRYL